MIDLSRSVCGGKFFRPLNPAEGGGGDFFWQQEAAGRKIGAVWIESEVFGTCQMASEGNCQQSRMENRNRTAANDCSRLEWFGCATGTWGPGRCLCGCSCSPLFLSRSIDPLPNFSLASACSWRGCSSSSSQHPKSYGPKVALYLNL